MVVHRFDVFLVDLDPTLGSEMKKTRPCLVISPDSLNRKISTFLIAPLTTKGKAFPSRVPCQFQGKSGFVVLDQIRTVDETRMMRKLGRIPRRLGLKVLATLQDMFAP